MHPPSSTLWRLTKLHLHWEHRGNVFKIAPATMVQQIQDIKRCDQIPFTSHCWLVSITTSWQTYAIYRYCWYWIWPLPSAMNTWNYSHLRLSFLGSSLVFSISVDSYLDHWQSCASSCRGPLGAAGNTDGELHQGRKANTISLIDSGNVPKLINVFTGFESNSLLSFLAICL